MLIIKIILGIFGFYFLFRIGYITSKNEDLIGSYITNKNPFLSESNEIIRDFKNNVICFLFIVITFSLISFI